MKRKKRRKRRLKKSGIVIIIVFLLFVIGVVLGITYLHKQNKIKKEEENKTKIVTKIKNHYNKYVITNHETDLYNSKNKVIGKIGKNVTITLKDNKIDSETKYFELADFEDTYIKYEDVSKTDDNNKLERYKNYIPYNQNITTKNITSFYDENHSLIYKLNKSYDFEIIIKDTNYYGIIFNNELMYINKDDVEKVYNHTNTSKTNSSGVAVLNYHAFYDQDNPDEVKKCTTGICMSKKQFKEEIDYFKEINIFTITMHELELYMDGKLQLPKSVLITIDDGGYTKIAVDMLTEYKMNATIFLITSRFDPKNFYITDYIELHSHSHNLHNAGICQGGQGAPIKCLDEEKILTDLKTSRELLNGTTAFCYPFYEYNSYSDKLVKEAGFTMAFIGEVNVSYGYKLAEKNGDKMHIPRFVMFNYTTITDLKNFFAEIK